MGRSSAGGVRRIDCRLLCLVLPEATGTLKQTQRKGDSKPHLVTRAGWMDSRIGGRAPFKQSEPGATLLALWRPVANADWLAGSDVLVQRGRLAWTGACRPGSPRPCAEHVRGHCSANVGKGTETAAAKAPSSPRKIRDNRSAALVGIGGRAPFKQGKLGTSLGTL